MSKDLRYVQARPFLDEEDIASVVEVLKSGHLEEGAIVRRLEEEISACYSKKFTCATTNGFSAIHLALIGMKIKKGDEVIIPAYTCPALLYPVKLTGATVVFADIGDGGFNMTPASVEKVLTNKTKCIIWPHMFGFPADLTNTGTLNKMIIEDVAQAMGGSFRGKKLGSFTSLAISSFYATKNITSGDGGALSMNDEKLFNHLSETRYYGGRLKLGEGQYYNYKMTNLNAALGLSQIRKLDWLVEERKKIASWYDHHMEQYSGFIHYQFANKEDACYQKYPVFFPTPALRDRFKEELKKEGVNCGYGVLEGLHKIKGAGRHATLKNTNRYLKQILCLPVYPGLGQQDIDIIMTRFLKIYKKIV